MDTTSWCTGAVHASPVSPQPTSETTCICSGQFLAYKQLPISSPCISLLLCLRVSAALSAVCLAAELGGSLLPGTIFSQWGMRVMSNTPRFRLVSSHSWSTFCKVSQSIPSSTGPTLSAAPAHHWSTWYCLVSHSSPFSYSLTGASQNHLPNKLHNPSPCLRAYLWEN